MCPPLRTSGSPYVSEEAHVASLQGRMPVTADTPGLRDNACKDGAEALMPAANGECEASDEGEISNNDNKDVPLHSTMAARLRKPSGTWEDSPHFKRALRRKKRVSGLRDSAS